MIDHLELRLPRIQRALLVSVNTTARTDVGTRYGIVGKTTRCWLYNTNSNVVIWITTSRNVGTRARIGIATNPPNGHILTRNDSWFTV